MALDAEAEPSIQPVFGVALRAKGVRRYCFTKDTGTWTTAAPPWGAANVAELARDLTQSTTEEGMLPVFVALTPDT